MATGGRILGGQGWGFGVGVNERGRYGWAGGYGTTWFNDPQRGMVAIAMTQVTDFLWNGGAAEFETLVADI
jgi:CubicO group peptidase (beta-lactamase class C family)